MDATPEVHAIAGAVSASVALALTYPLTTITTRQQIALGSAKDTTPPEAKPKSLEGQLRELASLYGGLKPAVAGTFISQGLYFYFFQIFKNMFEKAGLSMTPINSLIIGSIAGAVNVMVTNPVWVVVTRMQKEGSSQSFSDVVSGIYEREGVRSFWKGVVPSLILVSNPAIMYMVYEPMYASVKQKLKKNENVPPLTTFFLGAFSKLVATIFTFPIQTVKARLQAEDGKSDPSATKHSVRSIIRQTLRERGVAGLFKGIEAKIVQTVLNAALTMMLKDKSVLYVIALVGLWRRQFRPHEAKCC